MDTFEFKDSPYFTWRDDPATEKQKVAILEMWAFSPYFLPDLDFETLTKGEAADYLNKYHSLAHEDVNSPTFGY